ncbi:G-type lectin S-receptor-like serine/threonine-protein kinase At2g19130 [Triticum dicoccoides]|uniref:G-type lectin S-receptor-like serine/threonine-protein kinase At2g19130 n=1 Tax=Triticum dicoccoides TaxID=85692 RepID=UPI00189037F8|nr:G-type lectin S-receptor-like serine/threonine-protein kinase At2g19130 [Triticum dicoccoides]
MHPLYILSLGLLLFPTSCCSSPAPANDTLMAGQVLTVGDKLVSRNGKFALGFFQPAASTISKSSNNSWYLGIWFNKIPVFTTVWVANREEPIAHPNINSTQLKISSDGNLVIVVKHDDAGTESLVWSTHIVNRTQNSSINTTTTTSAAILLNTGNLAVKVTDSPLSDLPLWQSFDYPADVVLPGAKLGWNKVTGLNRHIISKKSLIDMSLGSYSLGLDTTGLAILERRKNPAVVFWHWASSKTLSMSIIPVLTTILDMDPRTRGLINPTYVDNDQEEYYMYTSPDESTSSTFVSLDISGLIKVNVWSQSNQSWQTVYTEPTHPCLPPATCGPFTVCSGNPHPSCDCMPNFSQKSPQDWEFQDRTGGCIRNTPLHCTSDKNITSSTDMFQPISQVTLPYNPQSIVAATQSQCEEACLRTCSCTAYSYNASRCSVWNGELLSVSLDDGVVYTSKDILYLRLAAKDFLPSLRKTKRKPNVGIVAAASIAGIGLLMFMLLLLIWSIKFKSCCFLPIYYGNQDSAGGIIAFRYTDLVRATKNFSEKLGGGGFGSVYKGVLSDPKTTIAVKRLDGAHQGEKQFRAEVSSVGLIQHINLVKLIGFCCEGDHRLLVYEHMLNGSLDGHLFKRNDATAVLNWNNRYQIALGVAKGLSYLHQSCHKCIIHCDIKPGNILLDASFAPKAADFGLAAFVGRDFSRVLTTIRGTAGYLAPEWLSGVAITPKIDVYSFGMVLLEIISGRRNSSLETSYYTSSSSSYHNVEYFPVQAINKLHGGDVKSLVDPELHDDFNLEEAERVCKVACWCIQDNEFDRPTMGEVVRVLEGLQKIDIPPMIRLLAALTEH